MSRENLRRHKPDLIAGALVAVVASVAAAVTMRVWHADLDVPITYWGDALYVLSMTKTALGHAWYLTNSDLGSPFGQHLQDFPVFAGDPIPVVALKVLGLVTPGDYPVAYNLYFLLGFPLTAISAFVVLRVLGVSRWSAAVCAVLFAILPFHFRIGAARPFETGYWIIPIAGYLLLAVAGGWRLFERSEAPRHRALAFATRRSLWTVLLCVVVASAGIVYFSLFAAILMLVATALVSVRVRSLRAAVPGLVVTGLIGGVLALNALPTIVYQVEHGNVAEEANFHRAGDSEIHSLSITQLLLPISGDRIGPLERLRDDYTNDVAAVPGVAAEVGLGPVAAFGFVFLLALALAAAVGAVRRSRRWAMELDAAALTVASLLIATTGGFSSLIAQLITPQFRVWERYYLFIAFFSLMAVGFLLDSAVRRLERGRRAAAMTAGLLAAVLIAGGLEQTSDRYIPAYASTAAEFKDDRAIVSDIEARLPSGAQVFQLPYLPFPIWGQVGPDVRTQGFDGFRPSLHSSDLRWSYGATRGRAQDWPAHIVDKPVSLVVPAVVAAGFDGLLVYRVAYHDNARRMLGALERQLGSPPILSPDSRWAFFDLQAYRAALESSRPPGELERLRFATFHPVRIKPDSGLAEERQYGAYTPTYQVESDEAEFIVDNPTSSARTVTLRLSISAKPGVEVGVRFPDGQRGVVGTGAPLAVAMTIPPGPSRIELRVNPSDLGRGPAFVVVEAIDSALLPFAAPASSRDAVSPQTGTSEREYSQPSPGILSRP